MAGHRQARKAPRRAPARTQRFLQRYETEADPLKKLGWAYDWLRFEIGHLARARLGEGVTAGPAEAAEFASLIAADLVARAQEVQARCYVR
jgi:hypothetical protein